MYRTLQNTTAGGRCVKDVKDKDTTESIFFLSFLCMLSFHGMLTLLLWNPEGLAGAQRRLVILIGEVTNIILIYLSKEGNSFL